ncbi:MAG TPA: cell division protein SepF [Virgibacillus sp.]|nr:cell division protein SepF [Virgibacillus sp.]
MSLKNKIKTFFTDEEYEYEYVDDTTAEPSYEEQQQEASPKKKGKNVVNLTQMQQATAKVVLYEPRTYEEAQEIADNIVNRRAVIINLQRVDDTQKKRIVDFLSGTVYAVKGDIQKLGIETFLCSPDNIDVSGNITESIMPNDDFERGW